MKGKNQLKNSNLYTKKITFQEFKMHNKLKVKSKMTSILGKIV